MLNQKHYIGYSSATFIGLTVLFILTNAGTFEAVKLSLLLSGFVIPIVLLCVYLIKYMTHNPFTSN